MVSRTLPSPIYDFNKDGKLYISGILPEQYSYVLLPDDSTLIFDKGVAGTPLPDTNFISSISGNQLVWYHRTINSGNTTLIIDSLYK